MWCMRYRYWPNNTSRMYVLENTGNYVKENGLKCGDRVMMYKDEENQFYISCKKAENATPVPVDNEAELVGRRLNHGTSSDGNVCEFSYNVSSTVVAENTSNELAVELEEPSHADDIVTDASFFDDYYFMDEHQSYGLRDIGNLPNFDDCGFFPDDEDNKDGNNEAPK